MESSVVFKEELKDKLENLISLNDMTQHLQKSGLCLSEAMLLFDIGLDPSYLNLSNNVFVNTHFLRGLSKLQNKKVTSLLGERRRK